MDVEKGKINERYERCNRGIVNRTQPSTMFLLLFITSNNSFQPNISVISNYLRDKLLRNLPSANTGREHL